MDISSDFKLTATKDTSRAPMLDVIDGHFAYQGGMTEFVAVPKPSESFYDVYADMAKVQPSRIS